MTKKSKGKGKRYTDKEKSQVLSFVDKVNATKGRGGITAAVLVWMFGARRWWKGLAVVILAALLGGAGELLQRVATTWRNAELDDWTAHVAGCAVVSVLYLLCLALRRLESPDAPAPGSVATDEWTYAMSDRTGDAKDAPPHEGP